MINEIWSYEELEASVKLYIEMQALEQAGTKYNKSKFYKNLSAKYGRTPSAFSRRMSNISYVLSVMGKDWLPGLKPATNVGPRNAAIIEKLFLSIGNEEATPRVASEIKIRKESQKPQTKKPLGTLNPVKKKCQVTQIDRDEDVKIWTLNNANGKCNCCKNFAPFLTLDGTPFLEVHHVKHLSDGGSDCVSNAVALCPNCHRELHYGINAHKLVDNLYSINSHLIRE